MTRLKLDLEKNKKYLLIYLHIRLNFVKRMGMMRIRHYKVWGLYCRFYSTILIDLLRFNLSI